MFAIELDMFSIGTIKVPIHIELVSKPICIPNLSIAKPFPKQLIEPVCVLDVNLVIPPNIVKHHLLETFFHPKVGKMITNETPTQE
jgi:hypothetical protein